MNRRSSYYEKNEPAVHLENNKIENTIVDLSISPQISINKIISNREATDYTPKKYNGQEEAENKNERQHTWQSSTVLS